MLLAANYFHSNTCQLQMEDKINIGEIVCIKIEMLSLFRSIEFV